MRIKRGQVYTTGEILKEFFGLEDRLLYGIDEVERYRKIYDYLLKLGATDEGFKEFNRQQYRHFSYQESFYLIPDKIFAEIKKKVEEKEGDNKNIILFKKAN